MTRAFSKVEEEWSPAVRFKHEFARSSAPAFPGSWSTVSLGLGCSSLGASFGASLASPHLEHNS
jgi:hypothetical protein